MQQSQNSEILAEALRHYFKEENWETSPVEDGINNITNFVTTPSGSYVLRIYNNGGDLTRINSSTKSSNNLTTASSPSRSLKSSPP